MNQSAVFNNPDLTSVKMLAVPTKSVTIAVGDTTLMFDCVEDPIGKRALWSTSGTPEKVTRKRYDYLPFGELGEKLYQMEKKLDSIRCKYIHLWYSGGRIIVGRAGGEKCQENIRVRSDNRDNNIKVRTIRDWTCLYDILYNHENFDLRELSELRMKLWDYMYELVRMDKSAADEIMQNNLKSMRAKYRVCCSRKGNPWYQSYSELFSRYNSDASDFNLDELHGIHAGVVERLLVLNRGDLIELFCTPSDIINVNYYLMSNVDEMIDTINTIDKEVTDIVDKLNKEIDNRKKSTEYVPGTNLLRIYPFTEMLEGKMAVESEEDLIAIRNVLAYELWDDEDGRYAKLRSEINKYIDILTGKQVMYHVPTSSLMSIDELNALRLRAGQLNCRRDDIASTILRLWNVDKTGMYSSSSGNRIKKDTVLSGRNNAPDKVQPVYC